MVELKALTQLEKVHLAKALNYLEAYKMEIGVLINFGNTKLEFKRLKIQQKIRSGQQILIIILSLLSTVQTLNC